MNLRPILVLLSALAGDLPATPTHTDEGVVLTLETRRWFGSARHHVRVPAELNQIVLEQQEGSAWRPLRTWHLTAPTSLPERRVAISLPRGVSPASTRIIAYSNHKFPAGFTRGRRFFRPRPGTADQVGTLMSQLSGTSLMRGAEAGAAFQASSTLSQTDSAQVVESDIWKMAGDTLFFFNQYRGLQVLDMTDPANPRRTGALRLPASGEQMFLLDESGSSLALLGRSNRRETAGASTLFLVSVQDGVPSLQAELPIGGFVVDSRLVGKTLHVLTQSWRYQSSTMPMIDWGRWISEAQLHSFDLTSIDSATALPIVVLPGQANCLQAANGHLLIGAHAPETWTPRLHILATHPRSAPTLLKSVQPAGFIQDKFKTSIVNGAICTVSVSSLNGRRETWVETFPLAGADTAPLAQMELLGARDETLHATRFDGNRLYVVTFLQVDPLFIVDLTTPATPELQGVLEIPGWSTYIEPLGDRLLAVGVEEGRVTASLFDVEAPGAPALLSRLYLGTPDQPSWSEAHYDEKAVHFDPVENLLLVPYEQWDTSGPTSAVEVMRVSRENLTSVQTLPHTGRARRGSIVGDHYVTISGQELQANPRSTGTPTRLTLAWRVDRVLAHRGHLIQVDDGPVPQDVGIFHIGSSTRDPLPNQALRSIIVTREDEPEVIQAEIEIENAPVIGMKAIENRLYLAQWLAPNPEGQSRLRTWVLDMTHLPDLVPITSLEQIVDTPAWRLDFDQAQALQPRSDLLVWHLPANTWDYRWWWPRILQIGFLRGPLSIQFETTSALPAFTPFIPTATSRIAAILDHHQPHLDESQPRCIGIFCPIMLGTDPEAATPVALHTPKSLQESGRVLAEGGFIFLSQDESTQRALPAQQVHQRFFMTAPRQPRQKLRVESRLHVLDCRSSQILVRHPVKLPGRLLSLHRADAQGAILLTEAARNEDATTRHVQATAYDGVQVWQLHELKLEVPAWSPEATDGTRLFFSQNPETPGVFSIAYEESTGQLSQSGSWSTTNAPVALQAIGNLLLASSHGSLEIANITETGLQPHAEGYETPINLWPRLERAHAGTHGLWLPVREYGVELLPWHEIQR